MFIQMNHSYITLGLFKRKHVPRISRFQDFESAASFSKQLQVCLDERIKKNVITNCTRNRIGGLSYILLKKIFHLFLSATSPGSFGRNILSRDIRGELVIGARFGLSMSR